MSATPLGSVTPNFGAEIVFRIREAGVTENRCSDYCYAVIDGTRFEAKSGRGASPKLARVLVAAGIPDAPWVLVRDEIGVRCLSGSSFYHLSKWTISEPDRGQPKLVKFVERPFAAGVAA